MPAKSFQLFFILMPILLGLALPTPVLAADISITEIMYDLEGTDADREWVEIKNISEESINLDDWYFYENETDHYLSPPEEGGDLSFAAGEYAVIADDPSGFQADHPDYSGLLVDSTFTLSNDGETIGLRSPEDAIVSSTTYDPANGADGNGDSLQLVGGEWASGPPTPGEANEATDSEADDDSEEAGFNQLQPREETDEPEADNSSNDFSVSASVDTEAIVGVKSQFSGEVDGLAEEQKEEASFQWSFGNGEVREGQDVFYAYPYPGEYVATVTAEYEGKRESDQVTIDAAVASIFISENVLGADGHITLKNNTGRAVDLSGWHLRAGGEAFTLPENTIHLDGERLSVSSEVSGLSGHPAALLFPDGTVATTTQVRTDQPSTQPADSYVAEDTSPEADNSEGESTEASGNSATSATGSESKELALADTFSESNTAAAAAAQTGNIFFRWGGLLVALVIAGIGIVVLLGRVSKPKEDSSISAAEFDINEL